jgi:heterodisulfide reductase subunit B
MKYLYYPGCSSQSTGKAYGESVLAVFEALGAPLDELEDWNCCGATTYMSISELKAFTLSARNLALAERQGGDTAIPDLVVPCAACYLGLNKAHKYLTEHEEIREKVNNALAAANLEYKGRVRIRHPLDVLVNEIGLDKIKEKVSQPLAGHRVACYYGCQLIRPYADFDDQHQPVTMGKIIRALGGEVIDWPLKTRCCGGSLTGTYEDQGLRLSYMLLNEAARRGATVIATACPLCQFNLECYQSKMGRRFGQRINMPVAFFTQLIGLAFGLSPRKLGLNRLFVPLPKTIEAAADAGGRHVHS